ncbi:MAG: methanogenesis marker protein Mmp4/MtxX [Candidatus Hermodarchaeota archaeon]
MTILKKLEVLAKGKTVNIGIGLGTSEFNNRKIMSVILQFLQKSLSKVYVFGSKASLDFVHDLINSNFKSRIIFIQSEIPEKDIFEYLTNKRFNSVIRGSLSSNKFLDNLKKSLKPKVINRIALLETVDGHQFFYGPVGIDECNNVEDKIEFIENAIKQLRLLNIEPIISVLSGGRIGDIGRNTDVDISIQDAEKTVKVIKNQYPGLAINHDEILIENAVRNKSNLIIAPNGISGNLIYRTLVHLGGGKAYGAIYMNLEKNIIDTSRVGEISEIQGAFILTLALSKGN